MKLKQLFIATLCTIIGMTCAAQNFGGDTIALFDFNNPATQIASGTGEFHTQTAYASTWHRVPGLHYISDSSFQNNYSTYVYPSVSQYFEEYLDSAFMLMSMWDGTVGGQHYDAWFEIGPIDASSVSMVEVRLQQLYRKYYDSCFVDYTDANGEWHTMEINVLGVDVNVNSWAPTTHSFTLPSDAAYNGQLMLRFRYKDRDWNGATGYAWAVDNVAVCRGQANNLQFYSEHYVEGFYGQIPQGLQTPVSWWAQVMNKGSITHQDVVASLLQVDANDNQIGVITSVSQPDLAPGTQPVSLFIEGQDNIAFYNGDHSYSSYYGYTGTVDNNAGLGTATPGINRVAAMISTDSASMQYPSYIYKVTTPDADGIYTWGLDNGLLLSGHAYKSGCIFNADYNAWFTTNESDNYNLAGYSVLNRYSTGSQIPVDDNGQPWVIRGIEVVPAAGPEASQYVGAVLSAKVYEEYTEEGSWGTSTVTTGSASYTVQASDINTQYGAMETGYNTVRIMFPEQVTLEPNKCYYAGYRLDNDHEFAAAATGASWIDADGAAHLLKDDSLLADYANIVANPYYSTEVYDPAYRYWRTCNDNAAMVRLLVGPRVEVAYHTLSLNSDDGYIALNGTENWYGSPTFSLAEGSYITGKFVPSYGFTLDSANITVAGNAVIYYEDGYWWFRIDNLNSDVYISAHYTSAFPATCQKQVPYSISQGDNWIDDCWETYNDEDSTMVYFSSSIRSPFISLPNNSDTYVVNLTVDNTATGVDEVVVYVLNQRNTFSIYRLLPLSSATVNQLSFMINDPQLAGNTIYFQIYFPAYSDYLMTLTDFSIATLNGIDTSELNMVSLPYGPRASHGDFANWTLEGGAELTANGCIKLSAPGQVAYSPWFVLSDSVAKLNFRPYITRGTSDSVDYWQDYGDCVGLHYGLDAYFAGNWMPSAGSSICNIIMSDGSWFETQNHLGRIVRWKYEYQDYGSNDSLFIHALNLFEYNIYATINAPTVVTAGQPVDLSLTYSTSDNDTTDMSFYWSTYTNNWSFYESMGSGQNITYTWETPGTYTIEVYAHKNNVFNGWDAAAYATTTVIVTEGDSTYSPSYIANLTLLDIDTIETNSELAYFSLELDNITNPSISWNFEGAIEESIGSESYGSINWGYAAWSQPGTYAVTATVSVNGVTDSRTTYITVVEPCHVSDYPYTTDFESGMNCWKLMYGWATLEDGTVRLSGANFGWIKSPVLDRGEGEYQISFRAKSSVATPQPLCLYMYRNTFHDYRNNAVSEEFDVSSTDWTNYTFTIPANVERINFGYFDQGNGDVWIDDIVISLVGSNTGDSTYTPNYITDLVSDFDTVENSQWNGFTLYYSNATNPTVTWNFEGAIVESTGQYDYSNRSYAYAAWSQPGTYAVTATVSVNGVTDSRTTYITVVEPCHVNSYPYTTDFESGMNCWKHMYGSSLENGTVRLSGADWGWIKSPVLDRGEGEYQISFRAKSSVTTPQPLSLYMYHNTFHDYLYNGISEEFNVSSTDWTDYTFTIPATVERINFGYNDTGNGNVWIDDIVISLVGSNTGDSTVIIVDTVYRDTVIYNITYLDSTVLNIQTIDSTVYNVVTIDSTVYNVVTVDSVVYNVVTVDSVVYNITNLDSIVYNINTVDSVVVNIIQSDSIIYFYDTTCATHDTITLTEYLHDTITITLHDTITITVYDTVYIHDSVGLDPVSALPITINVSGGAIVVDGAEGRNVQLYDAVGRLIATRQNYAGPVRFDIAASGTYLVKVDGFPARKVVAVR